MIYLGSRHVLIQGAYSTINSVLCSATGYAILGKLHTFVKAPQIPVLRLPSYYSR